jgi:2-polyprenyl-6-methoxyphenol hydroxylase-like FAD-dependent oxidoreductase
MDSPDYDAIVVGARAAGASTALLLARQGYRVLLVDRDELPSDIARGHFVYRDAPRRLQSWGLLDRILTTGVEPVTRLVTDMGDFPLESTDLCVDGVPWGIGPRRSVLDRVLLEAALEAGAQLEDQVAVNDVLVEDEEVVGVRARSARTGRRMSVRAPLTIGADGTRSRIARAVAAPMSVHVASLTCWYFSYWSGVPMEGSIYLYGADRRAIFVFPTSADLTAVFVAWPIEQYQQVRREPETHVLNALERIPDLVGRVRAGQRVERLYGTPEVPNFLRKPWGPGWALVGDASCHKDPMLALGLAHALRDAELLASAAADGLSGAMPLCDALRGYELRRNAATLPEFHENLQLARMDPPPPEVLALRSALRSQPEASRHFALANFGVVPRETFFNPENLGRIMAAAPIAA